MILSNINVNDDECGLLRLLLKNNYSEFMTNYWDAYSYLFDERHLLALTKYAVHLNDQDMLGALVFGYTSKQIYLRSSQEARREYL